MIRLFLKGILMGICDLIPGISGGTIAFITGIYSRLINAVKGFSFSLVGDFFKLLGGNKKPFIAGIKKLDLIFLGVLFAGIGTAILLGSRVVSHLLDNHFSFTLSFFIGLILASCYSIFKHIKKHSIGHILIMVVFIGIGIGISFLVETSIAQPPIWYVGLSGFLAVSAMFLPGISGSFILLILGVYRYMLDILHDPFSHVLIISVFIICAGLGAYTISHIVSYLFKHAKNVTLYALLGLVVGSLSTPIKRIIALDAPFQMTQLGFMFALLVLGVLITMSVLSYERHT